MSTVTVTRDIAAEPARVWAVITDIESSPETLKAVKSVELLTDGPYRVGTTWRETTSALGREETHEMKVTEVEALGFTRVDSVQEDATYVTTFKLEALHPGTRVTMTFDGAPAEDAGALKKLAAKVIAPLGDKAIRSHMESDLADIAAAAESRENH